MPISSPITPRKGRVKLAPVVKQALASKDDPPEMAVPQSQSVAEKSLSIRSDNRYLQMDKFTKDHKPAPLPDLLQAGPPQAKERGSQDGEAPFDGEGSKRLTMARTDTQGAWMNGSSQTARGRGVIGPQGSVNLNRLTGADRSTVPVALWQDSVDRSVKRLMVDFDLSDEPSCRLHHLDRMHHWFKQHGPKNASTPAETAISGPSYLTADRASLEPLPAGSTMGLAGQPSLTSELMASLYSPRQYGSRPVTRA
eukprot:TRINITY_DN34473_c0_g1_i1.p1 TRINITY_DN34473_c0_g1~~TRINITY_DN34473_c0_g1_i1.p1  ORF type:complete len:253 (+),score=23.39 TRINITY_DN34473_c0_g1_i1:33-791(+)